MSLLQKWFGFGGEEEKNQGDNTSPFDVIRHLDWNGEYWLGRELAPKLGYGSGHNSWRNFVAVIEKAKSALRAVGFDPKDHCVDVNALQSRGDRGGTQEIEDFRLDRRACYMVAICGDPRKQEVAAAKSYFITKTREAELAKDDPKLSRKMRAWIKLGKDWDWIDRRLKGQGIRSYFTETLSDHGVKGSHGFSTCTRTITKEVIGQYPCEIREDRDIKKTRDSFSITETVRMMFAEHLTGQMIEKNNRIGTKECNVDCRVAGENTRHAIESSLGIGK